MTTPVALELRDVTASYGRVEVLHQVSLTVSRGSIAALLGPNGAGKSTCLRVVSGLMRPTSGSILISGQEVSRRSAASLARSAYCCVPEGRGVFPNLTVADNVRLWAFGARKSRRTVEERVYARFPRLAERRRQMAGSLSGGEQQMLAISRALATDPSILLLDEISMGVAPKLVVELYESIVELVERETLTVLLVEQFAEAALAVSDHAFVLVQGEVRASGRPEDVRGELAAAYLHGSSGTLDN